MYKRKDQHSREETGMNTGSVYTAWSEIVSSRSSEMIDMMQCGVFYIAGGGLPSRFGNDESGIWTDVSGILDRNGDSISIAGVEFSREELVLIGHYARSLEESGVKGECIDERLDESEYGTSHVHDACGAAAATGAALGQGSVEDRLLEEFGEEEKQPIYGDMHGGHDSIVINVDFGGARSPQGYLRDELKKKHALPFSASIDLGRVHSVGGNKAMILLGALVKWDVQIARNIIGGHHNLAHEHANKTIIVVNKAGVRSPLLRNAMKLVSSVDHESLMEIG